MIGPVKALVQYRKTRMIHGSITPLIVHGSWANPSDDGALVSRPGTSRRASGRWPEPRPEADLDPAMLALHAEIGDRQVKILYRGTAQTSF